jgi:hypothetical protein
MRKKTPAKARPLAKPKRRAKPGQGRRPAPSAKSDSLLAPIAGADRREVGGVKIDIVRAGNGRVKRVVYPRGFRWSTHMKPAVGTDFCAHAHVGLLARGHVRGEFADGCTFDFVAPRVVVLEPGHDAWVVGEEAAVLIQFDAEEDTPSRFGLPEEHRHAPR